VSARRLKRQKLRRGEGPGRRNSSPCGLLHRTKTASMKSNSRRLACSGRKRGGRARTAVRDSEKSVLCKSQVQGPSREKPEVVGPQTNKAYSIGFRVSKKISTKRHSSPSAVRFNHGKKFSRVLGLSVSPEHLGA